VSHGPELSVHKPPQRNETGDDSNICSESVKDFEDSSYLAEGKTD